jgi:hypothetical protein
MRKRIIFVCLALVAVLLVTGASAMGLPVRSSPTSSGSTPLQDQRAQRIIERIETVIARFNNNKDLHIAAYNAAKDKVTEIVTTMTAQGYDTGKLREDLQTWNTMILKAAGDYATFISLLKTAEQYAPYASQGQFLNAIDQARKQLRVCTQDNLDVRHEYQTVIRPDVQALAGQTPKSQGVTPATSTP